MLDKVYLALLIVGVTVFAVSFWITLDFCIYRRKRAIAREGKTYNFYKHGKGQRVVTPHIKSAGGSEISLPATKPKVNNKMKSPKSRFIGFFSFIKKESKNTLNVPIIREEGVKDDVVKDVPSSRTPSISRISKIHSPSIKDKLDEATVSQTSSSATESPASLQQKQVSNDKVHVTNVKNKWKTSTKERDLVDIYGITKPVEVGRPTLPPLKTKTGIRSSTSSSLDTSDGNFSSDSAKSLASESSSDQVTKPLLKKTFSTSQIKTEIKCNSQKPSASSAKPLLIKRSSKNRIKPLDDSDEVFTIDANCNDNSFVLNKSDSYSKDETQAKSRGRCNSDNTDSESDKKIVTKMSKRSCSMNKIKMAEKY